MFWFATALTGGASNALDFHNGSRLSDGDGAFVFSGGMAHFYILDADSGLPESSPDVIAPDVSAGAKRWILQAAYLDPAAHNHYTLCASDGNPDNAVYVNNVGYMGIGTLTPDALLSVSESSSATGAMGDFRSPSIVITNTNGSAYNIKSELIYRVAGALGKAAISCAYTIYNGAGDVGTDLLFGTMNSTSTGVEERMRITHDGKVGIGTTSPAARLHVYNAKADTLLTLESGDLQAGIDLIDSAGTDKIYTYQGILNLSADHSNGAANSAIRFWVDGTEKARFSSLGYLGLGTASPKYAVDIDSAMPVIRLHDSAAEAGDYFIVNKNYNTYTLLEQHTASSSAAIYVNPCPDNTISAGVVYFFRHTNTAGAKKVGFYKGDGSNTYQCQIGVDGQDTFFNAGGRVGIGTATPLSPLHLHGDDARFIIQDTDSATSFFEIDDVASTQTTLNKLTAAGASLLDINSRPLDGTSAANIRLFRSTNTTGGAKFDIFRGNNSATIQHRLATQGWPSFVCADNTPMGVGTGNPSTSSALTVYHPTADAGIHVRSGDTVAGVKFSDINGTSFIYHTGTGTFILNPGNSTYRYMFSQTELRPSSDNVLDLGTSSYRFNDAYIANGVTTTSDAAEKQDMSVINDASVIVDHLEPVTFKFKDKLIPGTTETRVKQKVEIVHKTVEDVTYEEVGGKIVKVKTQKTKGIEVPVFDERPVFDEKGKPVLNEDGSQETTRIPVMETLEEVIPEQIIPTDGKTHFGVTTQAVAAALTAAGFDPTRCKILDYGNGYDEEPTGLIYSELIGILWADHKAVKAEVKELRERLTALEAAA